MILAVFDPFLIPVLRVFTPRRANIGSNIQYVHVTYYSATSDDSRGVFAGKAQMFVESDGNQKRGGQTIRAFAFPLRFAGCRCGRRRREFPSKRRTFS